MQGQPSKRAIGSTYLTQDDANPCEEQAKRAQSTSTGRDFAAGNCRRTYPHARMSQSEEDEHKNDGPHATEAVRPPQLHSSGVRLLAERL